MSSPSDPYPPGSSFPPRGHRLPGGREFQRLFQKRRRGGAAPFRPGRRRPAFPDHPSGLWQEPDLFLLACLCSRPPARPDLRLPRFRSLMSRKPGCVSTARRSCSIPTARPWPLPDQYSRLAASLPGDNTATAMKSVVADLSLYDWEGDAPLRRPFSHTIIYEMHVRGFTRHPSSGVSEEKRGTYAGLIEKIPYLQDLGITAVELLPVFQFDEQDAPPGLQKLLGLQPGEFSLPPTGPTAPAGTRSVRWMNSGTWSRPCTGPASR